jgi:hypothetical protein
MKTMEQTSYRLVLVVAAMILMAASAQRARPDGFSNNFTQTNLVSNIPGLAVTTDPDLVNPWGVSFSPASPFWVSDNGTGLATLYNGAGETRVGSHSATARGSTHGSGFQLLQLL